MGQPSTLFGMKAGDLCENRTPTSRNALANNGNS